MTNEEIKELLQIFTESGVGELEVQRGKDRVRICKEAFAPQAPPQPVSVFHAAAPAAQATAAPASPAPAAQASAAPAKPESNHVLVKSPIVGTFYGASSPEAPPFVKVGDRVEVGQVLCIIESMKLMNEIEAEVAGIVESQLVENGRPVEYGQELFAIKPSK